MPTLGRIPIVTVKPISGGTIVWRRSGVLHVTIVVKATFGMIHEGTARLVAPLPLVADDRYPGNAGSLGEAHDLAPFLPSAGVILSGSACAPQPVPALTVRLAIYRDRPLIDKTLHVFGDRAPGASSPQPFQRMPIVPERAFGGPSFPDNPVGIGAAPDARAQPNLVHPADPRRLAGFGPISSRWGSRRRLLGSRPAPALDEPGAEIPDGFDFRWFHAAPVDQQCDYLQGDEWIVLDGMHAAQPRLQTHLPGVRAQAVWSASLGGRPAEGRLVNLVADTLLIDADRQVCSLVWRGNLVVEQADTLATARIFAGVEMPGYPIAWPEEARVASLESTDGPPSSDRAPTETIIVSRVKAAVLPFSGAAPAASVWALPLPVVQARAPGLGDTVPSAAVSPFAGREALPFKHEAPPPVAAPPAMMTPPMPVASSMVEAPPMMAPPMMAPPMMAPPMMAPPVMAPPMMAPLMMAPLMMAPPAMITPAPPAAPDPPPLGEASTNQDAPASLQPAPLVIATGAAGAAGREKVVAALAAGQPLGDLDLSGADLHELDLHGQSLSGCRLKGADLRGASLAGATLTDADLEGAKLDRADLSGANLTGALLALASFKGAKLNEAKLDGARGEGAVFDEAAMAKVSAEGARLARASFASVSAEGSVWERATLDEASFRGATLKDANLQRASCNKAVFAGADLTGAQMMRLTAEGADLEGANLDGANLRKAELCGASLVSASLRKASADKADFSGARLTYARLEGASLRGAVLKGAILAHAHLDGADLRDADLEQANVFSVVLEGAKMNGARTKDMSETEPSPPAR